MKSCMKNLASLYTKRRPCHRSGRQLIKQSLLSICAMQLQPKSRASVVGLLGCALNNHVRNRKLCSGSDMIEVAEWMVGKPGLVIALTTQERRIGPSSAEPEYLLPQAYSRVDGYTTTAPGSATVSLAVVPGRN